MNRRLQKLARWGDKPVDDRQPAEMRMLLRSNIQPQFKPSYGAVMNSSANSQPQLMGTSSASVSSRSQSIQNNIVAIPSASAKSSVIVHAAIANPLTVPPTLPDRSLSLTENKDGNLFNREGLSSTPSSSFTTASSQQAISIGLPAFSSLHEQSQIFGLNPSSSSSKGTVSVAPLTGVSVSPSGESDSSDVRLKSMNMNMMGAMGGGMSMCRLPGTIGGKIDIDAIRTLQMQSVKELSDALKGVDGTA